MAADPGVTASPEQVRRLEELSREEREELVKGVVREVHRRGGFARFGWADAAGRLGGPPP